MYTPSSRGRLHLLVLALVYSVLVFPFGTHAAVTPSAIWYPIDPDTQETLYDSPYHLIDNGTVAVPFHQQGYIEIQADLPAYHIAVGALYQVPDPNHPETRIPVTDQAVTWNQPGVYEIDIYDHPIFLTQSLWRRVVSFFVPTAHALEGDVYLGTIHFTVTEGTPPPPPCCSSVLFLPGIEGSVLKDGSNTLWPPTLFDVKNDLSKLAFDEDGNPANTNVKVDGIVNRFPVGPFSVPVYEGFSSFMDSLVAEGTIQDWTPLAYDWRLPLQETIDTGVVETNGEIRDLVGTVENLASESKTGKVTIVAHSMGGLLAKVLVKRLEENGEADLIDNLILVGSPQLGTAQTVGGLLHGEGSDMTWHSVSFVNKAQARALGQNLETAYDLLPSSAYFSQIPDPVVTFATTTPPEQEWRDYFGECLPGLSCINSYDALTKFVEGVVINRAYPDPNDPKTPERLNPTLLAKADAFHMAYDGYELPASVHVVQIAGWGLDTIKGIKYTEDHGSLDYEPLFTAEGDGVVVYPSALASTGEQYYFNLFNYNELHKATDHSTLMTAEPVDHSIRALLSGTGVSESEFLSKQRPPTADIEQRLLVSAHSPVSVGVTDENGNFTGIAPGQSPDSDMFFVQNDIPGSQYLTFGEGKYVLLPDSGKYNFTFKGTGSGIATVRIEQIEGNTVTSVASYSDLPITPSTVATLDTGSTPVEETPIAVDTDGDGKAETTVTPDGYTPPSIDLTFEELVARLRSKIEEFNIAAKLKSNLLKRIDRIDKKIEKEKGKKTNLIEQTKEFISKKAGKGKLSTLSAAEITTMLDELETNVGTYPLDTSVLEQLKLSIQELGSKKLRATLSKRVENLEQTTSLLRRFEHLALTIEKKERIGRLSDESAQELLNLLTQIEEKL